jgi:hypothetical protein
MRGLAILLLVLFSVALGSVDPRKVVSSYAKYLADGNCEQWADLFAPNGCKIDSPAPACGHAALVAFCANAAPFVGPLAYSLRGPVLSGRVQDTFRCLAGFLLGGSTGGQKVIAQSGYNSFVINATTGLILECTGYLEQEASN